MQCALVARLYTIYFVCSVRAKQCKHHIRDKYCVLCSSLRTNGGALGDSTRSTAAFNKDDILSPGPPELLITHGLPSQFYGVEKRTSFLRPGITRSCREINSLDTITITAITTGYPPLQPSRPCWLVRLVDADIGSFGFHQL